MRHESHDDEAAAAGSRAGNRRVIIDGLEIVASVGVFEVEKRYEQRIIVSTVLDVVDDYDGTSDRLDDVLDYAAVVRTIGAIAIGRHYHLIETLAERIAEACLDDRRVAAVRIRIDKPDIMPGCRSVAVEIERRRS